MKRFLAFVILVATLAGCLFSCSGECKHDLKQLPGKASTCSEIGFGDYVLCTKCGYNTYEEIPMINHDLVTQPGRFRTCVLDGWDNYEQCKNCEYNTKEIKPALGHLYENGECKRCKLPEGDTPLVDIN